MTTALRSRYERLLRWYPRAWRLENGEFLLSVLEEDATARGKTKPSIADAWSVRSHGLAARATPKATLGIAVASLIVSFLPAVSIFSGFPLEPAWVRFAVTGFYEIAGLLLLFVTALMFGRRHGGALSAPAALTSVVLWMLHAAAATCARLSWSIGWDEKNRSSLTEDYTTWFGNSTLFWLGVAATFGGCALSLLFRSILSTRIPAAGRWAGAVALSIACLHLLFFMSVTPSIAPLLAGSLLVLSAIDLHRASAPRGGHVEDPNDTPQAARSTRSLQPHSSPSEPMRLPESLPRLDLPRRIARLTHRGLAALLVAAVATAAAGALCAAVALGGSTWSSEFRDSTHSMNIGLALGCLAVIPLSAVGAWMLARSYGVRWTVGGAFLVAALLLEATSQFLGAGHPVQEPLWLLAALCIGAALAIPLTKMIPASKPVSAILAIGGSFVLALTVGLGVPGLPFLAPVASLTVACWAAARLIMDARRSRPDTRAPGDSLVAEPS